MSKSEGEFFTVNIDIPKVTCPYCGVMMDMRLTKKNISYSEIKCPCCSKYILVMIQITAVKSDTVWSSLGG